MTFNQESWMYGCPQQSPFPREGHTSGNMIWEVDHWESQPFVLHKELMMHHRREKKVTRVNADHIKRNFKHRRPTNDEGAKIIGVTHRRPRNDEREKRATEDTHLSTSLDGVKFISESLDTGICLDSGSYRPVKQWPEYSNYDLVFLVKSFYALRESLRFPGWRRRGISQYPQDDGEYRVSRRRVHEVSVGRKVARLRCT